MQFDNPTAPILDIDFSKLRKFPHTAVRIKFAHLLSAHRYAESHMIINPKFEHTHFNPNEWTLSFYIEDQS